VTPTSLRTLLVAALAAGALGWFTFQTSYDSFVSLPVYAAVVAGVMGVFELVLARVVRDKVRNPNRGRAMHPMQIARAAVLAKASSTAGALLLGLYAGFFTWTLPRGDRLAAASDDALVSGITAGASLLLVVGALLLERSCRTPDHHEN
jgi:TctA family transporter